MQVVYRKYIKWSSLRNGVILYTGPGPSGKTLSAVRQLVEDPDQRRIVSNVPLGVPHEKFSLEALDTYRSCRILLDSGYYLTQSRLGLTKQARFLVYFLDQLRKSDSQVIHTRSCDR